MRRMLAMIGAICCTVLVVYARRGSESSPTVSISPPKPISSVSNSRSIGSPLAEYMHIGEVPAAALEIANVVQSFHSKTVATFEISPQFGVNRGGQFGGVSAGEQPRLTKREHPPVPNGTAHSTPYQFVEVRLGGKSTEYTEAWMWSDYMCGITSRGFIYYTKGRLVVAPPTEQASVNFLRRVIASDSSADLVPNDKVWDVAKVELVGLLMHSHPVAYEKQEFLRSGVKPHQIRELSPVETKLLEELSSGAELKMAWNKNDDFLQVLGAIRAKDVCLKCHDVKRGDLLGAFTYRIEEAIKASQTASQPKH